MTCQKCHKACQDYSFLLKCNFGSCAKTFCEECFPKHRLEEHAAEPKIIPTPCITCQQPIPGYVFCDICFQTQCSNCRLNEPMRQTLRLCGNAHRVCLKCWPNHKTSGCATAQEREAPKTTAVCFYPFSSATKFQASALISGAAASPASPSFSVTAAAASPSSPSRDYIVDGDLATPEVKGIISKVVDQCFQLALRNSLSADEALKRFSKDFPTHIAYQAGEEKDVKTRAKKVGLAFQTMERFVLLAKEPQKFLPDGGQALFACYKLLLEMLQRYYAPMRLMLDPTFSVTKDKTLDKYFQKIQHDHDPQMAMAKELIAYLKQDFSLRSERERMAILPHIEKFRTLPPMKTSPKLYNQIVDFFSKFDNLPRHAQYIEFLLTMLSSLPPKAIPEFDDDKQFDRELWRHYYFLLAMTLYQPPENKSYLQYIEQRLNPTVEVTARRATSAGVSAAAAGGIAFYCYECRALTDQLQECFQCNRNYIGTHCKNACLVKHAQLVKVRGGADRCDASAIRPVVITASQCTKCNSAWHGVNTIPRVCDDCNKTFCQKKCIQQKCTEPGCLSYICDTCIGSHRGKCVTIEKLQTRSRATMMSGQKPEG